MKEIQNYDELIFEKIKHINEYGQEYWVARELQEVLDYTQWRRFEEVIQRAIQSLESTEFPVNSHFAKVGKMVQIGMNQERQIVDYELSRYACYVIVQNGDPRKKVIALGQSYFAIKTRQQELNENFDHLSENQKRIAIRDEMSHHNKSLSEAARNAGVKNFANFHNSGYQGLYGGLGVSQIKEIKGLDGNKQILDYMGSTELAANLFRATQTDEKLRREPIFGEEKANKTHYNVGAAVRSTMISLGNKPPEDLPTPQESIQEIKKKEKEIDNSDDQMTLF